MKAQRLDSCFNLGAIWWVPCLGHLTPGLETWYPLYRRQGGPQGYCEWVQKILCPPGFDSWIVQPIASFYTDYAILAYNIVWEVLIAFDISFMQLFRNLGACWEFILIIVHSVLSTSSTDLIDHIQYVIFGHLVNLHWTSQAEELDMSIRLGPQRYKTACGRLKLEVDAGSCVCFSTHILGTSVKCIHSYIACIF
jgi:hypothetical protein